MKTYKLIILAVLFTFMLSGCGIDYSQKIPDAYYGASTVIGISAGLPEGVNLTIGYRKYEGLICKNETDARVVSESKATAEGLEVSQRIEFGEAAR